MPIYHVMDAGRGKGIIREWWRAAAHTFLLLLLTLVVCSAGLAALDTSHPTVQEKVFAAVWNAVNLISTLGDFTSFNQDQKMFMIGAMFTFLVIGGYAVSRLTGLLSAPAVVSYRENKMVERTLDRLKDHVIVIGFGSLGRLVSDRLRAAGQTVLIVNRTEAESTLASELGYVVVQGDAGTDESVLDRSGLDRAQALVITTEDPDRKLAITLMAHARNPKLRIAVTGNNSQRGALLQRAGATEIVVAEDLIAGALVERLGKASGA